MLFRGLKQNALSKNHFYCNLFQVQLCTDWTNRVYTITSDRSWEICLKLELEWAYCKELPYYFWPFEGIDIILVLTPVTSPWHTTAIFFTEPKSDQYLLRYGDVYFWNIGRKGRHFVWEPCKPLLVHCHMSRPGRSWNIMRWCVNNQAPPIVGEGTLSFIHTIFLCQHHLIMIGLARLSSL